MLILVNSDWRSRVSLALTRITILPNLRYVALTLQEKLDKTVELNLDCKQTEDLQSYRTAHVLLAVKLFAAATYRTLHPLIYLPN